MCANITTKVSTGVWMRQDFISISRHWQLAKQKEEPSKQSPENTTRRFPTFYLHCSIFPYGQSRGRARARCCNVNPTDPRDTISLSAIALIKSAVHVAAPAAGSLSVCRVSCSHRLRPTMDCEPVEVLGVFHRTVITRGFPWVHRETHLHLSSF